MRGARWLVLGALLPAVAHAAGPLGGDGSSIQTSRYAVDLTQTPVVAGARVTGLAGAYVALAEGVDGNIQTPVAPSIRTPHSVDHFDYDLGLGVMVPATLTSTDFFNTGHNRTQLADSRQEGFVFFTPAVNVQWGPFGIGATLELQSYSLRRADVTSTTRADRFDALFAVGHLQAARLFLGGQLALGAGLRLVNLDVTNPSAPAAERDLFNTFGAGAELGALWMPEGQPFRVGASLRSAVVSTPNPQSRLQPNAAGDRVVGDATTGNAFYLPDHAKMPWDLDVGAAVQLGRRPLNPRFIDPEIRNREQWRALKERARERRARALAAEKDLSSRGELSEDARRGIDAEFDSEAAADELAYDAIFDQTREGLRRRARAWPRHYVLVSSSLLVIGAVEDSVGVESFLQRVVARSGRTVGYSPRLGVESELIPRWLKIRAGSYLEPTRFALSQSRLHGTFGFDAKLLPWTVFGLFDDGTEWELSGSIDGSARYLSWGVGLGVWH